MIPLGAVTVLLAISGRHSHFGFGLPLLIVIAALVFVGVRTSGKRRARRDQHGPEPEWSPAPERPEPAPRGSAEPVGVSTPTPPTGESRSLQREESRPGPNLAWTSGSLSTGAGDYAVEVHGLTKRFGQNVAVDNVDLLVPRGCAFGYLGPNGAGKTTLIRTLLGLTEADGGTMSLLGIAVPDERTRALSRVGAIVDEPRFHPHLTGRENLRLLAAARGFGAEERIDPSLSRVGLSARADHKVASYSMGMRQRLGVASCLLGDPELLILDEPMNGLDPAGMHEMRAMIQSLVAEGRTVMLSSHLLDEVERSCDAVAIVDRGRVIRQGPIDELVRGAGTIVLRLDCADPVAAARVVTEAGITGESTIGESVLNLTLPEGSSRETVAEINRLLVARDISVYGLQEVRTSLEDWFLRVTSRLGGPS